MNIPDKVIDAADAAFFEADEDGLTASYRVIAEWARKEALTEAAEAAQEYIYEWRRVDNGDTFVEGIAIHTATVIRTLVGGDKTDD